MVDPVPIHEEFIEGVAIRDVELGPSSRVRVYIPDTGIGSDPNEKLPVILHFPGGGFCISQADWFMYYAVYTKLARVARAIVVSVYLRLAPENRLPAAIDDGFSALLWLTSLARGDAHEPCISNKTDFNRIFLIGDLSLIHI